MSVMTVTPETPVMFLMSVVTVMFVMSRVPNFRVDYDIRDACGACDVLKGTVA